MQEGTRRRRDYGPVILKRFTDHPGETIYLEDILKDMDVTKQQVHSLITHIRGRNDEFASKLEVVYRGQAWRYNPNAKPNTASRDSKPTKPLFELLAITKAGIYVLQDEQGEVKLLREA